MTKTIKDIGNFGKRVNVKRFEHTESILTQKAYDVYLDCEIEIYIDKNGKYYVADNHTTHEAVGFDKEVDLCAYIVAVYGGEG